MSSKPTGRARRALKQVLDARRENTEAPSVQGAALVGDASPVHRPPTACSPIVPRTSPVLPRRPELDAWASTQPGPLVPHLPDPVHPAHQLRPEQWMLLELLTTGMNAAADAQEAYDAAYANIAQLQSVVRRVLAFQVTRRDADAQS